MANPQKENGFTPIANAIVEALMKVNLSAYETRVLWFLFRKTYGWDKKTDWIALSQFSECIGIDRRLIHRCIKELLAKNMIVIEKDGSKFKYGFQKDFDQWDCSTKKTSHKTVIKGDDSSQSRETKTVINGDDKLSSKGMTTVIKGDDSSQSRETKTVINGDDKLSSKGMTTVIKGDDKLSSRGMTTKETLTKEPLQKNFYKRNVVNDIVVDDPPSLDPVSLEIPEKPKKEKPAKEKLPPDPEAVQLAAILFREIVKENPQSRLLHLADGDREKKIIGWAEDIDKLIRIDHQEFSIIEEVIIWTTQDSFWAANIQSGRKLRQKWDTLTTKMKHNDNGSVNGRKSDDYRRFNGIREWLKEKEEETEARID